MNDRDNITLPRELVQLALDALDYGGFLKKQQAITALRAALAAPRPEPELAQHRFRHPRKGSPNWGEWHECSVRNRPAWEIDSQGYEVEYRPLYTAPPAAAPRPEPVPVAFDFRKAFRRAFDLGQLYGNDADRDSRAAHNRADKYRQEFDALCADALAHIALAAPEPAAQVADCHRLVEPGAMPH
jgi:hypothetical protein